MYIKYKTTRDEKYIKNLIRFIKGMKNNLISEFRPRLKLLEDYIPDVLKYVDKGFDSIYYLKFDDYYMIGIIPTLCDEETYNCCRIVNEGSLQTQAVPIFTQLLNDVLKKKNFLEISLL